MINHQAFREQMEEYRKQIAAASNWEQQKAITDEMLAYLQNAMGELVAERNCKTRPHPIVGASSAGFQPEPQVNMCIGIRLLPKELGADK